MNDWVSDLADKAIRIARINKSAVGNHRQDMSLPVLKDLASKGYQLVTWDSNGSRHAPCRDLDKQVWDIQDFLRSTTHDAPIFSHSHPGDTSCTLVVSGADVPDVRVDSYGDMDAAITPRQPTAPTPKVVAPRVKNVPIPKKKEEVKPVQPEKKYKLVSPDVHKQLKDPFEKRVEEKKPEEPKVPPPPQQTQPTEEDREEWLRDLERETSKKVPHWITGLIKE